MTSDQTPPQNPAPTRDDESWSREERIKEAALQHQHKYVKSNLSFEQGALWADQNPANPASAWRPISEAPKDGTEVLLFTPSDFRKGANFPGFVYHAKWYDEGDDWGSHWESRITGDSITDATHFMPLPAPPTEEK